MKTYTLKSVIRRGSLMAAAFVVAVSAFLPATSASADALNPLTDRSLSLSSSAPGWDFKDGSGNETYAAPNSGANGKQTGNTFSFKVSTNSSSTPVKALTFQYCTAPAGTCTAPGNNVTSGSAGSYVRSADSPTLEQSDLNVAYNTVSGEPANGEVNNTTTPVFDGTSGAVSAVPEREGSEGHFIVYTKDAGAGTWEQNSGWTMAVVNNEDGQNPTSFADDGNGTGKNNYITLTNAGGGLDLLSEGEVKVVFFGTDDNYITNPGEGAFFVKINTWNDTAGRDEETNLVDGGVTVANVMNLGISIQTKVLETMDFSVGTVDPYTLSVAQQTAADGRTSHGTCDPILNGMLPTDKKNTLLLGSESAENSLSTNATYSTHSYFRLSSNASAGATVYYSGVTLSNTVGDRITPINGGSGVKTTPSKGTEQFGLALANNSGLAASPDDDFKTNYKTERADGFQYENGADNTAAGLAALNEWDPGVDDPYFDDGVIATPPTGLDPAWVITGAQKFPQLTVYSGSPKVALEPRANYNQGAGVVNAEAGVYDSTTVGDTAQFAFDDNSNLIPTPIAGESDKVVDCASAKVRYIANIAATTPAGIYTTKINFIAAPQY